jgi:putative ATPase
MRQAPEGGTWALATSDADAALLDELAARLPEPERPIVLRGALRDLPDLLAQHGYPGLLFDAIVGRDALSAALRAFPAGGLGQLAATAGLLRPGGHLSLTETVHRRSQRLHALLDPERSLPALAARLRAAEEAIYDDPDDPLVTWAEDDLQATFVASGLDDLAVETQETSSELQITRALLARWFDPAPYGARPSYAQRLARILSAEEILQTRTAFERALLGRAVPWRTVTIYVVGRKPGGYSTS